jgi:IclR family KDG regulon transcriptional repressor
MKTPEKVLDILELFLENKGGLSLTEISRLSGVNPSTASRICAGLLARDYLYQGTKRGPFTLGPKFLKYYDVASCSMKIRDQAYPFISKLSAEVCENVMLSVLSGFETLDIALASCDQRIQVHAHEGDRTPLHATAIGKLYMAQMKDKGLENVYKNVGFKSYNKNTITDLTTLKKELDVIKKEGHAFNDEEYDLGLRSVAAPIFNSQGIMIAGIAIMGPTSRMTKLRAKSMAPLVKKYAAEISNATTVD